ncbi:hypothetical protein COZ60_03920 [Candidatus Bathyarchaeota archaeon CG_4_8_14_3_um_filter_42_8]|nr:MAG: hypothetical protein COZ60_03920 [Candidatus Bathyarchaeota archaeon CG_4_8_14_3_um_filter_42_8]
MKLTYSLGHMLLLILSIAAQGEKSWWNLIREDLRVIFLLVLFLVNLLILAVVLYLAGLVVVGKKRALLSDAFIISLLGTVLSILFFMFLPYRLLALILSIIVWLLLIKRLYETGWLGAIAVGILAMVIFLAVTVLLALFFGIMEVLIERFLLWF